MTIEWSMSVGNIITVVLTLLGFTLGALGFFYALRSSIERTADRLQGLGTRIFDIETELKQLSAAFALMAAQDQRLLGHTRRMDSFERDAAEQRAWVRSQFDRVDNRINQLRDKA